MSFGISVFLLSSPSKHNGSRLSPKTSKDERHRKKIMSWFAYYTPYIISHHVPVRLTEHALDSRIRSHHPCENGVEGSSGVNYTWLSEMISMLCLYFRWRQGSAQVHTKAQARSCKDLYLTTHRERIIHSAISAHQSYFSTGKELVLAIAMTGLFLKKTKTKVVVLVLCNVSN